MCFDEGNPLHYGFVLYATGRIEKEYCAMTDENRENFKQHLVFHLQTSEFFVEG